jgi:hypothetical protein
MTQDERNALSREQLLYTMLCALVKKNDGEIRIKENEMDEVTKHDMMAMYYDKINKEIILSMHFLNTSMEDEVF